MKNALILSALSFLIAGLYSCNEQEQTNVPESSDADNTLASRPIPNPTFVDEPTRLVAIGDLHGDYFAAIAALKVAGVIDDDLNWAGGDTVVVQTGDQLDRGDNERAILDLFAKLEDQAWLAGGGFYPLLGNHETMNAELDFRYVTAGGWTDFESIPFDSDDELLSQYEEYQRGRVAAFRPGGPYATYLSQHNVTMVVGDTIFVHGGILPIHTTYGLEKLNREVQEFLQGQKSFPLVMESSNSPVWSRHYSDETDAQDCALLDEVLAAVPAQRIVVGHTVQYNGITSECDGKVWRIDVGMAAHYGGSVSVLEITGDEIRVLQ